MEHSRHRLVEARIHAGFTQQDLAEKLGTSQTNISRWETGEVFPSAYFQNKLCAFFGVMPGDLDITVLQEPLSQPECCDTIPIENRMLIGREQDLFQLQQLLVQKHGLVAVCGLPGVGKTALVAALARDPSVREQFPDGVLWAGLGAHPHKSMFRIWGHRLGITDTEQALLATPEQWASALRTAIGSQKLLLILDDAWREEAALMLKVGGPNCTHLVTTRFPALASSIASSPHAVVMVRELQEEQSLILLRTLAPDVITTSELAQTRQIIHHVGGLPLALKLIGNYLRKEGRNHQQRRIHGALSRLQSAEARLSLAQARSPDEPHTHNDIEVSLHSLLAMSDSHLSIQARAAFYALAVLPEKPATFSENVALSTTACSPDQLDELADMGVLEVSGQRYTLHQVISDYIRIQFAKQPQELTREVQRRLITYTLTFVQDHEEDYDSLAAECHLYTAALDCADIHGYHQLYIQLTESLSTYIRACLVYGAESYLTRATEMALTMESHEILPALLKILEERIRLRLHRGDTTAAHALAQLGIRKAEAASDSSALQLFTSFLNKEDLHVSGRERSRPECGGTRFDSPASA